MEKICEKYDGDFIDDKIEVIVSKKISAEEVIYFILGFVFLLAFFSIKVVS